MNRNEIEQAIEALERNGLHQQAKAARKRLERELNKEPEEVKIYYRNGRIFVQPPTIGNPKKKIALKHNLKEVSETARWEGRGYEIKDPKRGTWSFEAPPEERPRLFAMLKEKLSNFFPGAVVVNDHGDIRGKLEPTS